MIALALLSLVACSSGPTPTHGAPPADAPPAVQHVKLALNWVPEPEFGGFYQGVVSGSYAKAGFDVEIMPGGPGAPTLELLASGQADAAISAADDLLLKRSKGVSAIGVWPAFQLSPMGLMAHPEQGLTSFADIHGGKLALEVGGPLQRFLWKKYAWEGKVEMIPTTGSIATWLNDPTLAQQAYITAEPCAVKAKGAESVFLKASDAGWNPYGTLLAFSDPPPAWAPAFVKATEEAWTAYLADPTAANAEIGKLNDQLTPETLACVTEAQKPFATGTDGLGKMTQARWDELVSAMISIDLLPAGSTAQGAWKTLP